LFGVPGLVVAAGVLLRFALIALFPGWSFDLRLYRYFGGLVLKGINPYCAPPGGEFSPGYADFPPANLLLFAAVLWVWNSPVALRIFFALVDGVILWLLSRYTFVSDRPSPALAVFYAFNPFILLGLVVPGEDKMIIFLLLLLVWLSVRNGRAIGGTLAMAALACYKWMAFSFAPPLLAHFADRPGTRRLRRFGLLAALFASIFLLSSLPYFPANLAAYESRLIRSETNPPIHASPTMLLSALGLYHPMMVTVFVTVSLVTIWFLFLRRKLGIREAIVLGIFFPYMASPEVGVNRILAATLPFLLLVPLSPQRWLAVWTATSVSSAALYINIRGLPGSVAAIGWLTELSRTVFGQEGSPQHVVFMNLLPILMLFYYLKDKKSGVFGRAGYCEYVPSHQGRNVRMLRD
jgi:hypothetical protein